MISGQAFGQVQAISRPSPNICQSIYQSIWPSIWPSILPKLLLGTFIEYKYHPSLFSSIVQSNYWSIWSIIWPRMGSSIWQSIWPSIWLSILPSIWPSFCQLKVIQVNFPQSLTICDKSNKVRSRILSSTRDQKQAGRTLLFSACFFYRTCSFNPIPTGFLNGR